MLAGVGTNAEVVWIQPVDGGWLKRLRLPRYYPKKVSLGNRDHITLFSDAAPILCDYRAHVLVSKEEVLYLRNTVRKAAIVTKMSRSWMFGEDDAVKEVWRHGEKMLSQGIEDVYFMQKTAWLICAEYAILDWRAGPMRFPKKLLYNALLPSNYKKILLQVSMSSGNSTIVPWGKGPEAGCEPYALGYYFLLYDSRSG